MTMQIVDDRPDSDASQTPEDGDDLIVVEVVKERRAAAGSQAIRLERKLKDVRLHHRNLGVSTLPTLSQTTHGGVVIQRDEFDRLSPPTRPFGHSRHDASTTASDIENPHLFAGRLGRELVEAFGQSLQAGSRTAQPAIHIVYISEVGLEFVSWKCFRRIEALGQVAVSA